MSKNKLVVVNNETGEVLEDRELNVKYVSKEPPFIKTYIEDLSRLTGIQGSDKLVLYRIALMMDYKNEVFLTVGVKKEIADLENMALGSVNNSITRLFKNKLLFRKDSSRYIVNPDFFGRGEWKKIFQIKTTLTYSHKGKFILTEVTKKAEE